jgi:hypothetical protein
MGSSPSKSNNDDADKCYKKLYFDPEADSAQGSHYYITDGELREKLKELVDDSEKITEVRLYSHPLTNLQVTKLVWHHAFVVFETDKWWWSIEKNDVGVTIQRSKKFEYVRDRYRRAKRTTGLFGMSGITLEKKSSGSHTLNELIDHIYLKDYLNEEYDLLENNCQHFAQKIWLFI